jgi:hypothetical protein
MDFRGMMEQVGMEWSGEEREHIPLFGREVKRWERRESSSLSLSVRVGKFSWSTVCSPILEGGLGIRNLTFNKALLGKWL